MCAKHGRRGALAAYVVCRVGDILLTGAEAELAASKNAFRTFRAIDTARLTPATPIAFAGLLLERTLNQSISLSLTQYAHDLRKIDIIDHLERGQLKCPKKLRTILRQANGVAHLVTPNQA